MNSCCNFLLIKNKISDFYYAIIYSFDKEEYECKKKDKLISPQIFVMTTNDKKDDEWEIIT